MKFWKSFLGLFAFAFLQWVGLSQSAFVNLNFEGAQIPSGTQPGLISASAAVPGWSGNFKRVSYDQISLGGTVLSLVDSLHQTGTPSSLIGRYSAVLYSGPSSQDDPAYLSQTGLVPAGTESLRFAAQSFGYNFTVSLNGASLSLIPLSSTSSYTIYTADASSFAGSVATLRIDLPATPPPNVPPSFLEIDNITFSTIPVPEPSYISLVVAGFGIIFGHRRKIRFC
jgi:hypothetical protein